MRKGMLLGTLLAVVLAGPLAAQVPSTVTCPTGLTAGGPVGTYTVRLDSVAVTNLTGTPDSSNTAVVTVPASVSIPAGTIQFTFPVTPIAAGNADVGITVSGARSDCGLTVAAAAGPSRPTGAPTLSTFGLIVAAALLGMAGFFVARRV